MRRQGGYPTPQMTKAQNRTAFAMWLCGCSDRALTDALLSDGKTASLSRSYGIPMADVIKATSGEARRRRLPLMVAQ